MTKKKWCDHTNFHSLLGPWLWWKPCGSGKTGSNEETVLQYLDFEVRYNISCHSSSNRTEASFSRLSEKNLRGRRERFDLQASTDDSHVCTWIFSTLISTARTSSSEMWELRIPEGNWLKIGARVPTAKWSWITYTVLRLREAKSI